MAYTPITLQAWLTANPNYNKFPGTVSGKPLIYQAAASTPLLEAKDWYVWDRITEFPDLTQTPATADISTTGNTDRKLINIVPDAPAVSDLEVFLGEDTDAGIEALEGLVAAYQTALGAGHKFFFGHFMGVGKKSQVYAGAPAWNTGIQGGFPDPVTSNISITPNLGVYNKYHVITAIEG